MRKILIDQSPHRDEAFSMKAFFLNRFFSFLFILIFPSQVREKYVYEKRRFTRVNQGQLSGELGSLNPLVLINPPSPQNWRVGRSTLEVAPRSTARRSSLSRGEIDNRSTREYRNERSRITSFEYQTRSIRSLSLFRLIYSLSTQPPSWIVSFPIFMDTLYLASIQTHRQASKPVSANQRGDYT